MKDCFYLLVSFYKSGLLLYVLSDGLNRPKRKHE
jgi:hypothetical protein